MARRESIWLVFGGEKQ